METYPCANPNCGERVRPTGPDDGYDDRTFPFIHVDGIPVCGPTYAAPAALELPLAVTR